MPGVDPNVGRTIGPYSIGDRIAGGRSSVVYRAHHTTLGHTVALKLPLKSVLADRVRAQQYVHACNLAELRDPELFVRVLGAELTEAGEVYVALELADGRTLDELIRQDGPLPTLRAARVIHRIALAVSVLHKRGRPHGGLEPGKILIEGDRARLLEHELIDVLNLPLRDPLFSAPERTAGGPASLPADVYSIGVLLHFILTGSTTPVPAIPDAEGLGPLARELMTPDPSQRPASAMSVAMSVERLGFDLGELMSERPKKSRWRDSGVAKKRAESLRPGRGEPARDEGAPMGSVVATTTPPSRASSILPRPRRVPPAVLLGGGAVVLALLLAGVVARNARQDPITEPLPLAEGHTGETRSSPAAAKPAAAGTPSPGAEASSADASLSLAARPDAGLSRAGKVEGSETGARVVTPRVAPDAAVRVIARVDPGISAKTAPAAKGSADAGLSGVDALFTDFDAQLGKALAARGLNWDDLETADPVRTRQWGRWYRKAEVPTEEALREMYRSLAEGIDRAARQVGGTARSAQTSTVAN